MPHFRVIIFLVLLCTLESLGFWQKRTSPGSAQLTTPAINLRTDKNGLWLLSYVLGKDSSTVVTYSKDEGRTWTILKSVASCYNSLKQSPPIAVSKSGDIVMGIQKSCRNNDNAWYDYYGTINNGITVPTISNDFGDYFNVFGFNGCGNYKWTTIAVSKSNNPETFLFNVGGYPSVAERYPDTSEYIILGGNVDDENCAWITHNTNSKSIDAFSNNAIGSSTISKFSVITGLASGFSYEADMARYGDKAYVVIGKSNLSTKVYTLVQTECTFSASTKCPTPTTLSSNGRDPIVRTETNPPNQPNHVLAVWKTTETSGNYLSYKMLFGVYNATINRVVDSVNYKNYSVAGSNDGSWLLCWTNAVGLINCQMLYSRSRIEIEHPITGEIFHNLTTKTLDIVSSGYLTLKIINVALVDANITEVVLNGTRFSSAYRILPGTNITITYRGQTTNYNGTMDFYSSSRLILRVRVNHVYVPPAPTPVPITPTPTPTPTPVPIDCEPDPNIPKDALLCNNGTIVYPSSIGIDVDTTLNGTLVVRGDLSVIESKLTFNGSLSVDGGFQLTPNGNIITNTWSHLNVSGCANLQGNLTVNATGINQTTTVDVMNTDCFKAPFKAVSYTDLYGEDCDAIEAKESYSNTTLSVTFSLVNRCRINYIIGGCVGGGILLLIVVFLILSYKVERIRKIVFPWRDKNI